MPSPQQLDLLRAGLWRDDRGLAAWRAWRGGAGDPARLGQAERRLLPLAYANLGTRLEEGPDRALLKDAYRASWTANQLALRSARRAIEGLREAGIEALVLKGAALAEAVYGDTGARPIGDVDLAVRPERVAEAARALADSGLRPSTADPVRALESRHSIAFVDEGRREVDLHRATLWRAGLDREFWERSVATEVGGAPARILDPADQLLHVCAHGAAWNAVHPIRWAADAHRTIEAAGGSLDWERLAAMARRGGMTLPLAEALACLAEELSAPVPAATREELARAPVSARERRAHEALARPPSLRRSVAMLSWFREGHRAQAEVAGERAGPRSFARHMQGFWGLERLSELPGHAARRLLRRRA